MLLTRSGANSVFPLPEDLAHEDWWIPLVCASTKPIRYTKSPWIKYRIHKDQTSGAFEKNKVMSIEKWNHLECRTLSYYIAIQNKFQMNQKDTVFVRREILLKIMYQTKSISTRFSLLFSAKSALRALNAKIFFAMLLGRIFGYSVYRLKKMRK